MFNDDELRSETNINDGAPSSDNPEEMPMQPENKQQDDTRQQASPEQEDKAQETKAHEYYEPWQQPVYGNGRAPGQTGYSPGIHSGSYTTHQRTQPTLQQPNTHQTERKKRTVLSSVSKLVALILIVAVVSGGATYGVMQYSLSNFDQNQFALGDTPQTSPGVSSTPVQKDPSPSGAAPSVTANMTGDNLSPQAIYALAVDQVVGVNSAADTNVFGARTSAAVSGSGFIISSDGYIVTNYHVISYAVTEGYSLTVMLHNGDTYPAQVVGFYQDNDLAVIKIDATGLNAVTLGNNDDMKVGDSIYAVGNPLGELDYTMTNGIVSALDRVIQVDAATSINMFQIDAAVNSGNSGGPVYNTQGKVIGIVSAKYASTGVEGLGFAIPINDASEIIDELMTNGYVSGNPYMGITVRTVNESQAAYYNTVPGAYVLSVTRGSSADRAGLKVGDIITKLGDAEVTSDDTLKKAKKEFRAGDTTTLIVHREGEELTLTITFDEEGVTLTSSQSTQQPILPSVS